MRHISEKKKTKTENQNTHFTFNNFLFCFTEGRAIYEIMSKNMVGPGRLQITKHNAANQNFMLDK